MKESGISTLPRFLFLNTYAILLLLGGIGFVSISFIINFNWWIFIPCLIAGISCFSGSMKIFRSWKDKKRKYSLLIQRNTPEFTPHSFKEYMKAPCGRLLVILVLKDLGIKGEYRNLWKLFHEPFLKYLKESCRKQQTVVKIYEQH